MFRHEAAGIGQNPNIPVGGEHRAVTVRYSGPVQFEARDADTPATVSVDPAIRQLGEDLLAACQAEGVCLWFGHDVAGIGCHYLYEPPASSRDSRLAEDIRVTRVRVASWPGQGHEERLTELLARAQS